MEYGYIVKSVAVMVLWDGEMISKESILIRSGFMHN